MLNTFRPLGGMAAPQAHLLALAASAYRRSKSLCINNGARLSALQTHVFQYLLQQAEQS